MRLCVLFALLCLLLPISALAAPEAPQDMGSTNLIDLASAALDWLAELLTSPGEDSIPSGDSEKPLPDPGGVHNIGPYVTPSG